ncbi:unnamed protein product [Lactuca saligna]|uniref:Uncharacterized protein n=1 Tax=Lactuca saligna TaxID=75948 RepID=A0AA36E871_LACSI|nr:unnamed protein product [Lactuca saligna]
MPSQYCLEPVVSFDIQNSQDLQLDLSITLEAFRFRSCVKVVNVPSIDSSADHLLFSFYLRDMKTQYEMWSSRKIKVDKVTGPIETENFPNVKFKVLIGSSSQVHDFTLVDLPCLNPYD